MERKRSPKDEGEGSGSLRHAETICGRAQGLRIASPNGIHACSFPMVGMLQQGCRLLTAGTRALLCRDVLRCAAVSSNYAVRLLEQGCFRGCSKHCDCYAAPPRNKPVTFHGSTLLESFLVINPVILLLKPNINIIALLYPCVRVNVVPRLRNRKMTPIADLEGTATPPSPGNTRAHHGCCCQDPSHRYAKLAFCFASTHSALIVYFYTGLIPGDGIGREVIPV